MVGPQVTGVIVCSHLFISYLKRNPLQSDTEIKSFVSATLRVYLVHRVRHNLTGLVYINTHARVLFHQIWLPNVVAPLHVFFSVGGKTEYCFRIPKGKNTFLASFNDARHRDGLTNLSPSRKFRDR